MSPTGSPMAMAMERASALLAVNRAAEAARGLTAALADEPDHAAGLALLAYCLDDPVRALSSAEAAVAADPQCAAAHAARADVLRRLGRWREAVPAATVGLRLAPATASAHRRLARCLLGLYQTLQPSGVDDGSRELVERARQHADRALALAPDDPDGHVLDGDVHAVARRPRRARAAYRRTLARAPDHPDALRRLADTEPRASRAVHRFAGAAAARPDDPAALDSFHDVLRWWLVGPLLGLWTVAVAGLLLLGAGIGQPVTGLLAVGVVAYLLGYGWHRYWSFQSFPPAARMALPRLLRRPSIVAAGLMTGAGTGCEVAALTVVSEGAVLALIALLLLGFGPPLAVVRFGAAGRRSGGAPRPGPTAPEVSRPGLVAAEALAPDDPTAEDAFWRAVRWWLWRRLVWLVALAQALPIAAAAGAPRPIALPLAVAGLAGYGWWLARWSAPALPPAARSVLPGQLRRPRFAVALAVALAAVATGLVALAFPAGADARVGLGLLSLVLLWLLCAVLAVTAAAASIRRQRPASRVPRDAGLRTEQP